MEPEVFVPPSVEFEKKQDRKIFFARALFALGAVALLSLLGYFIYNNYWNRQLSINIIDETQKLLLVSRVAPFSGVLIIDTKEKTATPFTAPAQGSSIMLDVATQGTSTEVYLLSNPSLTVSNIYKQDRSKVEIGLTQVTASQNFKYDLSYDFLSNTSAYVVDKGASSSPHIVVYTQNTNAEITLGEGTRPTLLPGGFFVVYQKGEELVAVEIASKKMHTLIQIPNGEVYAVDATNKKIALYNETQKEIQWFEFPSTVSASYLSSEKVSNDPQTLSFSPSKLLITYASKEEEGGLVFEVVGTNKKITVPLVGGEGYKVSTQYE